MFFNPLGNDFPGIAFIFCEIQLSFDWISVPFFFTFIYDKFGRVYITTDVKLLGDSILQRIERKLVENENETERKRIFWGYTNYAPCIKSGVLIIIIIIIIIEFDRKGEIDEF